MTASPSSTKCVVTSEEPDGADDGPDRAAGRARHAEVGERDDADQHPADAAPVEEPDDGCADQDRSGHVLPERPRTAVAAERDGRPELRRARAGAPPRRASCPCRRRPRRCRARARPWRRSPRAAAAGSGACGPRRARRRGRRSRRAAAPARSPGRTATRPRRARPRRAASPRPPPRPPRPRTPHRPATTGRPLRLAATASATRIARTSADHATSAVEPCISAERPEQDAERAEHHEGARVDEEGGSRPSRPQCDWERSHRPASLTARPDGAATSRASRAARRARATRSRSRPSARPGPRRRGRGCRRRGSASSPRRSPSRAAPDRPT